jgi:hypothetical protein
VANQHEISPSFGGVGVTGAEADARVIVIDRNAIALCSCGRREKRSREVRARSRGGEELFGLANAGRLIWLSFTLSWVGGLVETVVAQCCVFAPDAPSVSRSAFIRAISAR